MLEIGTGSGYQAAILVAMQLDVYTIEIVPDLKTRSTRWLTELGYMHTGRLHTLLGDGYMGWPSAAPFDGIVVTCSPVRRPYPPPPTHPPPPPPPPPPPHTHTHPFPPSHPRSVLQ